MKLNTLVRTRKLELVNDILDRFFQLDIPKEFIDGETKFFYDKFNPYKITKITKDNKERNINLYYHVESDIFCIKHIVNYNQYVIDLSDLNKKPIITKNPDAKKINNEFLAIHQIEKRRDKIINNDFDNKYRDQFGVNDDIPDAINISSLPKLDQKELYKLLGDIGAVNICWLNHWKNGAATGLFNCIYVTEGLSIMPNGEWITV